MRRLLIVLGCAAFLGCTPDGAHCVRLPGGAGYCLQTTEGIAPFEVQQKIGIRFDERHETMIAQLEVDADRMRLAVLSLLGQSLLQADFSDGKIEARGIALQKLDPAFLLAVIQLALWDLPRVQEGLGDSAQIVARREERIFVRNGQPILRIRYTRGLPPTGDMEIELPDMNVAFRIETLWDDAR